MAKEVREVMKEDQKESQSSLVELLHLWSLHAFGCEDFFVEDYEVKDESVEVAPGFLIILE